MINFKDINIKFVGRSASSTTATEMQTNILHNKKKYWKRYLNINVRKITVPTLESVTEVTVSRWLKSREKVVVDEPLVELETDKVNVEVPAPSSGVSDL